MVHDYLLLQVILHYIMYNDDYSVVCNSLDKIEAVITMNTIVCTLKSFTTDANFYKDFFTIKNTMYSKVTSTLQSKVLNAQI